MTTKGNSLKKAAMLEAMRYTLGNVTEATAQAGISRKTHYQWMQTDPEYRENVDAITEAAIDFVEGKLFQLIDGPTRTIETPEGVKTVKDAPNVAAVIYFLKTRGKARGYVERHEVNAAINPPVQLIIPQGV
jgi:hypothetical protein